MAQVRSIVQDLSQEQIQALLEENARLKAEAKSKLKLKIAKSGGVSVYGMGKWPTTLYRSQWETLLDHKEAILQFIEDNARHLKTKE